jgi:hypothetical protein
MWKRGLYGGADECSNGRERRSLAFVMTSLRDLMPCFRNGVLKFSSNPTCSPVIRKYVKHHCHARTLEFDTKRGLIDVFEQAGTKLPVYFDGATDDLLGQSVRFRITEKQGYLRVSVSPWLVITRVSGSC